MNVLVERSKALFLEATEGHAPEEWPAFLDRACADDTDLRAAVERLLRSRAELGSFHECAHSRLRDRVDTQVRDGLGSVIGPYKLLQQIGEGGMGTVYMAEQTQPVHRKVALKVIKPGMDSRQVVTRFEAERQALALMDHFNIARVFDGGTTESDRPYFVMELVHGVPITKYCDDNHLTPRQRLDLFVPVCQAIQHAHQKGIIHRDIKPSNVMVTLYDGKPVPKVIDFGVAKAIEQKLTERTLFTQYGTMVGTLEYMSPEQAAMSAQDVDTRSDIYSLGVLLYELLTGTTPFDKGRFKQTPYDEIRRIIREEDPPKPSTRLAQSTGTLPAISAQRQMEPVKLTRLVRGELDWIAMKALEKDRERRYETANELALEVRRYLEDRPVQACPPSAGYRFRKFARRNTGALLTATLAFGVLVAVVVTLGVAIGLVSREEGRTKEALADAKTQQARAEANLAKADANFQQAMDAVDRMLTRVAETNLGGQPGLHPLRKQLLTDALKFYQEFLKERGSDPQVRFEAARAYGRMAGIYVSLGEQAKGDEANQQSFAILAQLCREEPSQPKYQAELAKRCAFMGISLRETGRRAEEVEQNLRSAIRLFEDLVTRLPRAQTRNYRIELAFCHSELGYALMYQSDRYPEAEQALLTALALKRQLALEASDVPGFRLNETVVSNSLGVFYRVHNRLPQAEQAHRRALEVLAKLASDFPGYDMHAEEARTYMHLGLVLWHLKRRDEAIAAATRVLELDRRLGAAEKDPGARGGSAIHYHQLGRMLELSERKVEAEEAYRNALALAEQELAEYADVAVGHEAWINVHFSLSRLLAGSERLVAAKELIQRIATWSPTSNKGLNLLAWRLATEPDARFRDAKRALELARKLVERTPDEGMYRNTLGVAEYRAGNWKAAIASLDMSRVMLNGNFESFNLFFLAMSHWQLGEKDQAGKYYRQAVLWMERNKPHDEELIRFRAEAAQLLKIADKAEFK